MELADLMPTGLSVVLVGVGCLMGVAMSSKTDSSIGCGRGKGRLQSGEGKKIAGG